MERVDVETDGVQARPEGGSKGALPRRKKYYVPRREQYYVAGPMSGIPQFNFPAFFAAAASLQVAGYETVCPAELDDVRAQNAALASPDGDPAAYEEETGETWGDFLARDVKLIADEVSAVVLLEGWEKSKGARLEAFVARTCGKPVYSFEKWQRDYYASKAPFLRSHQVTDTELAAVMEDEVFVGGYESPAPETFPAPTTAKRNTVPKGSQGEERVTSETGGQKGRKPQRTDLLPPEALLALSEVYGMGAEKYEDHNYLKGYDWSLSFGALLRHVLAAENGEWLDEESGLPHVMHAAWHCFALFLFEKHGLGTDDRIKTVVEGMDG